ncbi:MAG: ABC transporter ATP-binding protein [Pseudoclavibacter sp.]|nr:ABC transporter ATP-binding protein [Pseudoclavibacter sp.]
MLSMRGACAGYRGGAGVRELDLELRAGEIVALIGFNGAGKTTLMRLALGMLPLERGRVSLFGESPERLSAASRRRIGSLLDAPFAYPELRVHENLRLVRLLRGAPAGAERRAIEAWGLGPVAGRRARALSLGNRQRLGLAAALLHEPELVLLDEPGNGLDPLGVLLLREALRRRRRAGAAVLIGSHHLDEAARLADRVLVMNEGRIIARLDPAAEDLERALFRTVLADARERGPRPSERGPGV